MPAALPKGLKRVLIVCPNWLGDVLFATPFLRAFKQAYPNCEIDALLPRRVEQVLKHNPNIRKTLIYNERIHLGSLWQSMALAGRLRGGRYDAAILLTPSKTRSFLMKISGIAIRAGYHAPNKKTSLTHTLTPPDQAMHKIDHFLHLAQALGIPSRGREMDFFPDTEAQSGSQIKCNKVGLSANTPYAVMHIGGNWHLKRWPIQSFAKWAQLWLSKNKGLVVICGTASEMELARLLMGSVQDPRLVSLCGQTSLDELAWLLKGAQVMVSNDSGPIHLAATQKTPIVALFGPTSSALTGPVSSGKLFTFQSQVGCEVPCYFQACSDHLCMRSISPEKVYEKTLELSR